MTDGDFDEMLGIDRTDPTQKLALDLVDSDFGLLDQLVALRIAQELTQAEVAQRMGVLEKAVKAFEQAMADPKLSTIRRYALAVGALVEHKIQTSSNSDT